LNNQEKDNGRDIKNQQKLLFSLIKSNGYNVFFVNCKNKKLTSDFKFYLIISDIYRLKKAKKLS
jgi:hypothetical protein